MLTKEAFNALLKTLEEPPAHVKFMFATTEAEKVLPTILSRCQRFDLRRIPAALIVQHLGSIARQENVRLDEAALHAIARGADGGMRDAESTLDQLISFCGSEIAETDVLSMFGLASRGQILALGDALLAGEAGQALGLLNDLAQQGKDIARLVAELLNYFRNLLIFQVSKGDLRLIEASEAEAAALAAQASRLPSEALTRMLEVLSECEGRLRDTASKRILVEVSLLKMIEARDAMSIDTVLKQVQQLRAEAASSPKAVLPRAASPVAARPAPLAPPAPVSAVTAVPAETDLNQLWAQLVEAVGRANQFLNSYLKQAHPVSLAKNVLTIGYDPEDADQLPLVDNSRNHAVLQTKLAELGYPHSQVRFIVHDAPEGEKTITPAPVPLPLSSAPAAPVSVPAPATPAPVAPAATAPPAPLTQNDFKNDPLIQKALEVFKGQIIDVRS
jgi:DNA polymerase-3 subunit gamma/tau